MTDNTDESSETVLCPGCNTEMNDRGLSGNYRLYTCPGECSITIERALTGDHGGMSIENLKQLSEFNA